MKAKPYGIIAIIHLPGVSPECDEAHFDGWYSDRQDARDVFALFKKRYPEADVFVVEQTQAAWRQLDTTALDDVLAQIRDNFEARCEATST
jgi:hypothetical protein